MRLRVHAGVHEIMLIAFALAATEFLGAGGTPIAIDVEGHGRDEELVAGQDEQVDLSRTVGWFTAKYPVALEVGGLSWAQVLAGDAKLGTVIKAAKEQLRSLPEGLNYGALRYLNSEVDLDGPDPVIGFNYLGRQGATSAETSGDTWQICWDEIGEHQSAREAAHPADAHRRTQCRHDRHRCRAVPVRSLDVGALGTQPRAGESLEPVMV